MRLKQPQNGIRLSPKPPQEPKGIEPVRITGREDTYKEKIAWLIWKQGQQEDGYSWHASRGCLKCKGQNNEDKEYLAQMGDAKKKP